jgi:AraC-like DNA-binding protein
MYEFNQTLLLFSILQLLLTGTLLLFSKTGNKSTTRFLALFLISKGICFTGSISWNYGGPELNLLYISLIAYSFDLVLGPFIYFYVKKSTFNELKIDKRFFAHLLPFMVLFIFTSIYYFMNGQTIKNDIITKGSAKTLLAIKYIELIVYSHFIVYSGLAIHLVAVYRNYLSENHSEIYLTFLKWLQLLLGGFIVIWVLNILQTLLGFTGEHSEILFSLTMIGIFAFANLIVVVAIRFPEIFQYKIPIVKQKYEKTMLSENEKQEYIEQLKKLMISEKLFLSSTLSLYDISQKLKVQNHISSQIINSGFGKNFYDFVNMYRVEECKKHIKEDSCRTKTLLEIAFECGFNSKSVFNDSFKKHTGITPSSYRKKLSRIAIA